MSRREKYLPFCMTLKRKSVCMSTDTMIPPSAMVALPLMDQLFLAINYGRLARLRLVTGYPEALDWTRDEIAPKNDGIFIVDIKTGKKRLLVSYRQLDEALKQRNPEIKHRGLFINHTLLSRKSDRAYFFVRGGWSGTKGDKINMPCSIHTDGFCELGMSRATIIGLITAAV